MSATMIRLIPSSDREDRPCTTALLVACVACAVVDAIAVGILLFGTPLAPWLKGPAAAVSHGAAVLLLFGTSRAQPSRRWLSVAAVLAVPFVGAAVAAAICATRGRGLAAREPRMEAPRRLALTVDALQRLGGGLSPCDALDCGDEEQRRAALSSLSRRGDPEAIALLRRTAAGADPDLALSAALTLDQIRERGERKVDSRDRAEVRYGSG